VKYAFMTFSCPDLTFDAVLDTAQRFGYDGVELRISSNHRHGLEWDTPPAVRRAARAKAEEAGVALCCVATSCRLADPAAEGMIEQARQSINLAADLGAPRIRVFGGKFPEAVSREEATEVLTRSLSVLAEHAQARGVVVCLETHDAWCDPAHVAEVMRRVDHPAVGVNWDIMHPVRVAGKTMDEAFEALRPWIGHVHFHDGCLAPDRPGLTPIGEGDIDHRRAVALLKGMGYTGFLSGEWIGWEPCEVHLPRELATMKRYESEAD